MVQRVTPERPLKLAFLGGGLNSAVGYVHYAACRLDGLFEVVAGCFGEDPETNACSGRRYGVAPERVYPDLETLLDRERGVIDAIVILTPTPAHAAAVRNCLDHGVAVICEKALATTAEEARGVLARAGSEGFLAVTYNYTGYPMIRELRHWVANGYLGRLHRFDLEMPQEAFVRTDIGGNPIAPQNWRLHDGRIPTLYLDLGVHLHHLLVFLTGDEPAAVTAVDGCHGMFPDIRDTVMAMARTRGGLYGQIRFDKTSLGHRNGLRVRLYGSRGAAEWFQAEPETLSVAWHAGKREIVDRASETEVACEPRYQRFKAGHPAGFLEAFANVYADVHAALVAHKSGEPAGDHRAISAARAVNGMCFMEALAASARDGTWHTVPVSEPDTEES